MSLTSTTVEPENEFYWAEFLSHWKALGIYSEKNETVPKPENSNPDLPETQECFIQHQPISEMSVAVFHWRTDFFGLNFTLANRIGENESQALNCSSRTTAQIVPGMQTSKFWQWSAFCCLEPGLKTLLKKRLTAVDSFLILQMRLHLCSRC